MSNAELRDVLLAQLRVLQRDEQGLLLALSACTVAESAKLPTPTLVPAPLDASLLQSIAAGSLDLALDGDAPAIQDASVETSALHASTMSELLDDDSDSDDDEDEEEEEEEEEEEGFDSFVA